MIDFKYFAGFIDADGSLQAHVQKVKNSGGFYIHPVVSLSQKKFRAQNLEEIASFYEVSVCEESRNPDTVEVRISGDKGRRLLEQIKKHLVIKDELAEYLLNLERKVYTQEEVDTIRQIIKSLRKKNISHKNFPSRKWMAGYIDGDGCVQAYIYRTGSIKAHLTITSWNEAQAGLELVKKVFGGCIIQQGNASRLQISFSPSKVRELYDYFGKHLRIKKDQMILVRDYIGNNRHSKRNGATDEQNKKFCDTLATTKSKSPKGML